MIKNIIENAIRFKSNIVIVKLTNIGISIIDDGKGIEELEIPKLTEAFYRIDSARERKTGGYGLGLYLCKLIAIAHENTMDTKSKIGNGTEVNIIFGDLS